MCFHSMGQPLRRALLITVAGLILSVALAACGGGADNAPQLQGVRSDAAEEAAQQTAEAESRLSPLGTVPAPTPGEMVLPAIEVLEGRILLVKRSRLYDARFDDQEAVELMDNVGPFVLLPSPAQDAVAYVRRYDRMSSANYAYTGFHLEMLSLDSRETLVSLPLDNARSYHEFPVAWSPDGSQLLIFLPQRDGLHVIGRNGTHLEPGGLRIARWTTDGSIVTAGLPEGYTPASSEPVQLVARVIDVNQGQSRVLDIPLDDNLDLLAVEPALMEAGYELASTPTIYQRTVLLPDGSRVYLDWPSGAVFNNSREMCYDWEIHQRSRTEEGRPEVLATIEAATAVSDLTRLPDGTLLFLRWTLTDCQFVGAMQLDLMRLRPGETPEVLIAGLDAGASGNPNEIRELAAIHGRKYAVSPDGQYVLWLGGGYTTGTTTLNITELATGRTTPLLTDTLAQIGEGFESVIWLSGTDG